MHCIPFNCFMHVFDFYTLSLCSLCVELPYGWFSVHTHSHHCSLRCEIKLSYWAQPLLNFFCSQCSALFHLHDFSQSFQLTQSTCTCPHEHTHTHTHCKIYHSLMMMAPHTHTLLICLYSVEQLMRPLILLSISVSHSVNVFFESSHMKLFFCLGSVA